MRVFGRAKSHPRIQSRLRGLPTWAPAYLGKLNHPLCAAFMRRRTGRSQGRGLQLLRQLWGEIGDCRHHRSKVIVSCLCWCDLEHGLDAFNSPKGLSISSSHSQRIACRRMNIFAATEKIDAMQVTSADGLLCFRMV
jgi:hypothetical protein